MSEPTCRTCYYNTLDDSARERFLADPITMPVHYCTEHQRAYDNMLSSFNWDHDVLMMSTAWYVTTDGSAVVIHTNTWGHEVIQQEHPDWRGPFLSEQDAANIGEKR